MKGIVGAGKQRLDVKSQRTSFVLHLEVNAFRF